MLSLVIQRPAGFGAGFAVSSASALGVGRATLGSGVSAGGTPSIARNRFMRSAGGSLASWRYCSNCLRCAGGIILSVASNCRRCSGVIALSVSSSCLNDCASGSVIAAAVASSSSSSLSVSLAPVSLAAVTGLSSLSLVPGSLSSLPDAHGSLAGSPVAGPVGVPVVPGDFAGSVVVVVGSLRPPPASKAPAVTPPPITAKPISAHSALRDDGGLAVIEIGRAHV